MWLLISEILMPKLMKISPKCVFIMQIRSFFTGTSYDANSRGLCASSCPSGEGEGWTGPRGCVDSWISLTPMHVDSSKVVNKDRSTDLAK